MGVALESGPMPREAFHLFKAASSESKGVVYISHKGVIQNNIVDDIIYVPNCAYWSTLFFSPTLYLHELQNIVSDRSPSNNRVYKASRRATEMATPHCESGALSSSD